jgi:hypothetical protein
MILSLQAIFEAIIFIALMLTLFFNIRKYYASSPYKRGNLGCGYFLITIFGVVSLYIFITTYPEEKRLKEEVEKTKIEDIASVEVQEATPSATFNLIDTSVVISDRSQIKTILNGIQSAKSSRSDRRDREWKVKLRLNYKNNTYKQFLVERIDRSGPVYIYLLSGDTNSEIWISQVTDIDFVLLLN